MHFYSQVLNNVQYDTSANGTLAIKVDYKQICIFNHTHTHMKLFFQDIIKGLINTNKDYKEMNLVLFQSKTCEPKNINMSFNKSSGLIKKHRYQHVYQNITSTRYANYECFYEKYQDFSQYDTTNYYLARKLRLNITLTKHEINTVKKSLNIAKKLWSISNLN